MKRALSGIAGGALVLLGLVVLVGWHWEISALLQIRPSWAPMQYNTALGFLLLGGALLARRDQHLSLATGLASLVALLGAATLLQYLIDVDLGIDQALMEATVMVETSHPGRMAPNTALCFVVAGAAILATMSAAGIGAAGFLAVLTASLGGIALAGYLVALPTAYGWGNLTRMAAHTSIGFLVAGVGIFAMAVGLAVERPGRRRPAFVAMGAVAATATLSIGLWQALLTAESLRAQRESETVVQALAAAVARDLDANARALERLARRWEVRRPEQAEWLDDAGLYVRDTVFEDVGWVDAEGRMRWQTEASTDLAALWRGVGSRPELQRRVDEAGREGRTTIVDVDEAGGWDGCLVVVPLDAPDRSGGFMVAGLLHRRFFEERLGQIAPSYDYAVRVDGELLLGSIPAIERRPAWAAAPLAVVDARWVLVVAPRGSVGSATTPLVLVFGAGLAVALGWALTQSALARRRLVQLSESMEALEQRTDQLQRANAELEEFAYAASHDLRSPIRGIENLASWIDEDPTLSETSREHLDLLRGRVRRLDSLLGSLLVYARAGGDGAPPEEVDLEALLADLVELVDAPEAATIRLPDRPPRVRTDPTALQQVLLNLLANAIKHRDRDDITVTVGIETVPGGCAFTVTDDGAGIPPEHRERVFEMFQTLQPRDTVEGSGMGLPLVRKYVDGVGGAITIEGTGERGVTFRVVWPCEVVSSGSDGAPTPPLTLDRRHV